MELTVKYSYLGQNYEMTFRSDVENDLNRFEVASRITNVLQREVRRGAEITAVALKDQQAYFENEEAARARKREGIVEPPKPPAMVLAAGTKDPKGRAVLEP